MDRSRTTMTATILLALAATLPQTVQSADDRAHRGHRGGPPMMSFEEPGRLLRHLGKTLELDDTQQQEIANIVDASKPEVASLKERARDSFSAIRHLDPASADYATDLQNLATDSGRLASEATLLHGRIRAEVYAVLTPEQRQKLVEREEQMRRRFAERDAE